MMGFVKTRYKKSRDRLLIFDRKAITISTTKKIVGSVANQRKVFVIEFQ